MKHILILGIAVVLVVLAGWYLTTRDTADEMPQNGDPDTATEPVVGDPSAWRTYESGPLREGFGFTISHPAALQIDTPQQSIVTFKYIGPESEPNTEITDGFLVTVRFADVEADDTLEAYARDVRTVQPETITAAQFGTRDAVRFTATSELDDSDTPHVAARISETVVADISYSVMGDVDGRYQNTVERMLRDVAFTDANGAPTFREVSLAFLSDGGANPDRGCDDVVLVPVTVEPTTAPLTAALEALFAIDDETYEGYRNFIARTTDTLSFDRATVSGGTAHIYLTGELSGLRGVCDNPRAAIQIEATALQFATVEDVVLYRNGEETDLTPDGRGE